MFPPEGNLDIDAGDGGGGGAFRTPKNPPTHLKKSQKIQKGNSCKTGSHFWTCFTKCYKISSYIQIKAPNPINALKITN